MKIDQILVTTDLSEDALRPCEAMADLARSRGAHLTLLHVVEDYVAIPHGAPMAPGQPSPGAKGRIDEAMEELERQRQAFGDLPVKIDVVTGPDTAKAIADYADEHAIDLIAVSTHGRTGFRHLVLGSVAQALLRHARVPVMVFPPPRV
jgi:universal stress protein A